MRPTRGIVKNGYVFLKSSIRTPQGEKSKMKKVDLESYTVYKIPAPHFRAAGSKLIRAMARFLPSDRHTHAN